MAKHLVLAGMLAGLVPLTGATAQPMESALVALAAQLPPVEELDRYTPVFPEVLVSPKTLRPSRALLDMIASWLRVNFDLPVEGEPPQIEFVPSAKLVALRYSGFTIQGERYPDAATRMESSGDASGIYALYDDKRQTIYLREDWQGRTFTEVSVLVHEMVHHLQNLAGMKYACVHERERLAYEAQGKWLAMFGKDPGEEFGIDPFTVFARGLCVQ
jgi:hypothetical protein